jgi:hypothetical protein
MDVDTGMPVREFGWVFTPPRATHMGTDMEPVFMRLRMWHPFIRRTATGTAVMRMVTGTGDTRHGFMAAGTTGVAGLHAAVDTHAAAAN